MRSIASSLILRRKAVWGGRIPTYRTLARHTASARQARRWLHW